MKIVAFLQNQWFKDPQRVEKLFALNGEGYRRRFIRRALFAGCITGQRLHNELGDLIEQIVWEEVSRTLTARPTDPVVADIEHIAEVIISEQPSLIIAFGRIAREVIHGINTPVIYSPHPAARREIDRQAFRAAMNEVRLSVASQS